MLWFDGLTGTALVLDAQDVHRVSLFPGPCVVIECGDCSMAVSRAERGWGVHGLAGRPTLHQLLGLPAVVSAVLAMGRGLN